MNAGGNVADAGPEMMAAGGCPAEGAAPVSRAAGSRQLARSKAMGLWDRALLLAQKTVRVGRKGEAVWMLSDAYVSNPYA